MIYTARDNVQTIVLRSTIDLTSPSFLRKQPDFKYRILPMLWDSSNKVIQSDSSDPFRTGESEGGSGMSINATLEVKDFVIALIDKTTMELALVSTEKGETQIEGLPTFSLM